MPFKTVWNEEDSAEDSLFFIWLPLKRMGEHGNEAQAIAVKPFGLSHNRTLGWI